MKRLIGALLLTLGLVAGPLEVADAAPRARDCAIVDTAEGGYFTQSGVATLGVSYNLGVPACRGVTYTLTAVPLGGGTPVSSDVPVANQEVGSYTLTLTMPNAEDLICVALTITGGGGRTLDHVPSPELSSSECGGTGTLFDLDGGTGGLTMR